MSNCTTVFDKGIKLSEVNARISTGYIFFFLLVEKYHGRLLKFQMAFFSLIKGLRNSSKDFMRSAAIW